MRIHLFRPGTFTPGSGGAGIAFSEGDLKQVAEGYDTTLHEAPLCIGHPRDDLPAYGWVKSLEFADSGLYAKVDVIDLEFADMVQQGKLKKVSAAFYSPSSANNPKPGQLYLRHVAFLGAQPPAVKGLKPLEFKDKGEDLIFAEFETGLALGSIADILRGLRESIIAEKGIEAADKAVPLYTIDRLKEIAAEKKAAPEPASSSPTFSENNMPSEDLAKREAELKTRELAFAERVRKERRSQHEAFVNGLIKEVRLPAAKKEETIAFLEAQDGLQILTFTESDSKIQRSPSDVARGLLQGLPPAVTFGEVAKGEGPLRGDALDPGRLAHDAIIFQEEMAAKGITVSITDAVAHVEKGERK